MTTGVVLEVRPSEALPSAYRASENMIVGNVCLYGATSGSAYSPAIVNVQVQRVVLSLPCAQQSRLCLQRWLSCVFIDQLSRRQPRASQNVP